MVLKFKIGYEEKRRTCNELLSKDKKGVAKVAENKTQMQKLMEDANESFKYDMSLGDIDALSAITPSQFIHDGRKVLNPSQGLRKKLSIQVFSFREI